jgi:ABC-type transport system involved in multi-copper enzyme maturation permease subunit
MTDWTNLIFESLVLCLVQYLAAIPWISFLTLQSAADAFRPSTLKRFLAVSIAVLVGASALLAAGLRYQQDEELLYTLGRLYGAILYVQLLLDFFVVTFFVLSVLWRRGAAVAVAAFREGVRQPTFLFLTVVALLFMLVMPYIPYFTFGEDLKMVRELGYDVIMLFGAIFAVLTASISISEEIEGRTAVTLMSKPVSRRQFLLGKFTGILLASLFMTGILSVAYFFLLWYKPVYDRDVITAPVTAVHYANLLHLDAVGTSLVTGIAWWFVDAAAASPGLILGFCQVMVLLAIAVALATRLPMVVNLVVCLVVFFLGHLAPVLVQASQSRMALVQFMAKFFEFALPSLEMFNLGPALSRDTPPPLADFSIYVGSVAGYAVLYTAIALIFGLILFEDRDLA